MPSGHPEPRRRKAKEISPASGGGFHGVVTTPSGAAVAEAAVYIVAGPPHSDIAAVTDDAGRFSLGGGELVAGLYRLGARSPGGAEGNADALAVQGQSVEANIVLGAEEPLIAPEMA